jgi:hypothetical protein
MTDEQTVERLNMIGKRCWFTGFGRLWRGTITGELADIGGLMFAPDGGREKPFAIPASHAITDIDRAIRECEEHAEYWTRAGMMLEGEAAYENAEPIA